MKNKKLNLSITSFLFVSLLTVSATNKFYAPNLLESALAEEGTTQGLIGIGGGVAALAMARVAAQEAIRQLGYNTTNVTTGAKLKASCGTPMGAAMCVMGGLAIAQGVANLVSAKKNLDIKNKIECTGIGCDYGNPGGGTPSGEPPPTGTPFGGTPSGGNASGDFGGGNPYDGGGELQNTKIAGLSKFIDAKLNEAQKLKDSYKALGYEYDETTNTMKTPRGKINPASMGSAAGMSAAGFSAAEIAAAEKGLLKIQADIKKSMDEFNQEFGDLMGDETQVAKAKGAGDDFDPNAFLKNLLNKQNQPAALQAGSAVGLTRKLASGQAIGVAQDNIFQMISRRYGNERRNGSVLSAP